MKNNKPRLTVVEESKSGMNRKFRDNRTGETLTRFEVAKKIDNGNLTGYHHYRSEKGYLVIRSNPNSVASDNLD